MEISPSQTSIKLFGIKSNIILGNQNQEKILRLPSILEKHIYTEVLGSNRSMKYAYSIQVKLTAIFFFSMFNCYIIPHFIEYLLIIFSPPFSLFHVIKKNLGGVSPSYQEKSQNTLDMGIQWISIREIWWYLVEKKGKKEK